MNEIRRALYERLSGDVTLMGLVTGVHHAVAPQGAATPFVVFHKQSGTPQWQFSGAHIQTDLWMVKGIDAGPSASRAEDIAARISDLLTDAALTVTDRDLLTVFRESDIDYSEQDGADTYRHCGGLYRLITEPA